MEKKSCIAALNDAFRKEITAGQSAQGQYVMTSGVQAAFAPGDLLALFRKIAATDDFPPENDPYGEHDFGSAKHGGEDLFWKIDYYDKSLTYGSEDPADSAQTKRVLTIMLTNEY
jgi:hypothetical protein